MSDEPEAVAVVAASEPAPPAPASEPAPAAAPAPAPAEAAELSGTAIVVERWFNAHIANSPVARSVEAINHLRAALPALVAALLQQKD